jgi:hypothetical protein
MKYPSTYDAERIFLRNLAVRDIADALPSFDHSTPAEQARAALAAARRSVAGVRQNGWVSGYLLLDELGAGACGDYAHPLDQAVVLADSTSLIELTQAMVAADWALVRVLGEVNGIVTRTDLQDPPVRMWLFGMITVIELRFQKMIEQRFEAEEWVKYMSPARLEKARRMLEERQRRGQESNLVDCLQFSDKAQIVARDEILRGQAGFASRNRAEEGIKRLERLRNNLAHSQSIVDTDWEIIANIAEGLQRLFDLGYFDAGRKVAG